jgi:hypothetical protein
LDAYSHAERQRQVWYTNTHFLTASRFVSKVESKIGSISERARRSSLRPARAQASFVEPPLLPLELPVLRGGNSACVHLPVAEHF